MNPFLSGVSCAVGFILVSLAISFIGMPGIIMILMLALIVFLARQYLPLDRWRWRLNRWKAASPFNVLGEVLRYVIPRFLACLVICLVACGYVGIAITETNGIGFMVMMSVLVAFVLVAISAGLGFFDWLMADPPWEDDQ